MSLESRIPLIRKAIKGSAEEMATKEFLNEPEARHYDKVFELYKQLRDFSPILLDKVIKLSAKAQELKDDLGPDLNSVFRSVVDDKNKWFVEKAISAIEQIIDTKELTPEMFKEEKRALVNRMVNEMNTQIKNDPKVIASFSGKEQLLEKATSFMSEDLISLIDSLNEENLG